MANSVEVSWAQLEAPDHLPAVPPAYDPADFATGGACGCDCGCDQAPDKPAPPVFGARSVRYASGELALAATDLSAPGFGTPWGHTRVFMSRLSAPTDAGNGTNWQVAEWPYLAFPTDAAVAVLGRGLDTLWFDRVGAAYEPRFTAKHGLAFDADTDTYHLAGLDGSATEFTRAGAFVRRLDPAGNETLVVETTANGFNPAEVQRAVSDGTDTATESFLYEYADPDAPYPRLVAVTLRRRVNAGPWADVDRVEYSYYGADDPAGSPGDLRTATTRRRAGGGWADTGTTLYRYHTAGAQASLLRYVVLPVSYARLAAAVGNPLAADNEDVAAFADHYFEYDAAGRVLVEATDGGASSTGFTYAASGHSPGLNAWASRTEELRPDGATVLVYANAAGRTMLHATVADGAEWYEYFRYDAAGELDLHAGPSAVTGYAEAAPDLVGWDGAAADDVRDDAGLVRSFSYHAASGFLAGESVRRGTQGSPVPVRAYGYTARPQAGKPDAYFLASETLYPDASTTATALVTSYGYDWHGDTARVKQKVTTFPVVSTGQNGSGVADARTDVFDAFGRRTWAKDEAGFLTRTAYDPVTGGVLQAVADVNTSLTPDEPTGWVTPAGGGLHVVTAYELDDRGRATKVTHPNGRVDFTVYDDAAHAVRSYPGWDAATGRPTGPTAVSRADWGGGYTESLAMSAAPAVAAGRPTGAEAVSALQSLTRTYTDVGGKVTHADAYFSFHGLTYATGDLGVRDEHYYRTRTAYDAMDRPVRAESAAGTVTRTVYDGRGRVASEWVGTSDTPTSGEWSPTNLTGTDTVKVRSYEYDGGGVGNGNLTAVTEHPGLGAPDRVRKSYYDWRDRLVAAKAGVEATESTAVHRPIGYTEYDNLGRPVAAERYDGDGVVMTSADGVPVRPLAARRRARSTSEYDARGRAYRTKTYSVDPETGDVSSTALTATTWFDPRGLAAKAVVPNGPATKTAYDGLGRVRHAYVTDGGTGAGYADALSVATDTVLTQTTYDYDGSGNPVRVTTRDRFHDATGTGGLGTPTTGIPARVSFSAAYYDKGDRPRDAVAVGTNGGADWPLPGTVPTRSDTALVTTTEYDPAGRVRDVTDPAGRVHRTEYDALGRVTRTVEHYTDGTPTTSTDKTTTYEHGPAGMTRLTAVLPDDGGQTTEWAYGVSPGAGSGVASNDVPAATRWPDPATGGPSSGEEESKTVNALGETATSTDRNGTTHTFSYDVLGRPVADAVTELGEGVDGAVRRIEAAYDGQGNAYLVTSFDAAAGGGVVNQVKRAFNGLGQLTSEAQEHAGAVSGPTPAVGYAYSAMAGGANHSRPTGLTYPSGFALTASYAGGLNDAVGRLTALADASGTVEAYEYAGLGGVVRRSRPQPGAELTYVKQAGEPTGDGGDPYTGLDRFGRVVDHRWLTTGTGAATDRFRYDHDPVGNRRYRDNAVHPAFGEAYAYDGLNQLTGFVRGTLNAAKDGVAGVPARKQSWAYDAVGNWDAVDTSGVVERRTHNRQNEVTGIRGGRAGLAVDVPHPLGGVDDFRPPAYDRAGNMTGDERGKTFVYDAWNRLVRVDNRLGAETLVAYGYDGLNRRVTRAHGDATTRLYYSAAWQVVEERVSGATTARYVWSPEYVDAMVLRDRATVTPGALDERLWVMQDANFNVVVLMNSSGDVVERFVYDPFGGVTIYSPDYSTVRPSSLYAQTYLWQGRPIDSISGTYNFRSREASWTMGRPIQSDMLGFGAGEVNFYRWEGNGPVNMTDPLGLDPPNKPGSHERAAWEQQHRLARERNLVDERIYRQRKLQETVATLKPNWADATGRLYYHEDSVTICPKSNRDGQKSKGDIERLADKLYAGLKVFQHFDKGNITSATHITSELGANHYAVFGVGPPATVVAGNYSDGFGIGMFVQLKYDDKNRRVAAQTLGSHPLVGVRIWDVTVSGSCITITTMAMDRRRGPFTDAGFMQNDKGPNDTAKVWRNYLQNIVNEGVGAGWTATFGKTVSEFRDAPGEAGTKPNTMRSLYFPESMR